MKIMFAASECVPFVKTGGLADVIGALPQQLREKGEEVCVVMPLYKKYMHAYREQLRHKMYFYLNLGWRRQYCGIEELVKDGIRYIFLDNEYYFGRDSVYGYSQDECERFAFFCRAVLEALPHLDFKPDVIHCHDWQTGMIPVLLRRQYGSIDLYRGIRTVYTIHNLRYQGLFGIGEMKELFGLEDSMFTAGELEFYGGASFMKGGLLYADAITTVSPNYANEIRTAYYGEQLDGVINARANDLYGVINGLDMDAYDPRTDKEIAKNFSFETLELKTENKTALQQELGLKVDASIPMIGMVTRLTGQKGLDLVEYALERIIGLGVQLVILGTGDERYVNLLKWAQWRYQGQLSACIEMNFPRARRIYAGCDLFLMPSQFEPCGLSQLIAMRYGTLPIVRETGGLKDTVIPYDETTGIGTGFTFYSYNADDMLRTIRYAVSLYKQRHAEFVAVAEKAMQSDFSWGPSAQRYIEIYQKVRN